MRHIIAILALALATAVGAAQAEVVDFAPTAGTAKSSVYSVAVDGRPVRVEQFLDVHYAHFGFTGAARITVRTNGTVQHATISPRSYNIEAEVQGDTLSFTLTKPRKLIITINGGDKLFIFADSIDSAAPAAEDARVVNILAFGVDNTGERIETQKIQQAIDTVSSRPDGGILYFPPGVYKTGTISIKSGVTVYLAAGAVILGSSNPADYPLDRKRDDADGRWLILFDNAVHAGLMGRGTVDGNGTSLRAQGLRSYLLRVDKSRDILIEGVLLRDSSTWNTHIFYSEDVTVRNVKIVNNTHPTSNEPNTDGINPDASRRVLIEDVFIHSGDDNIAIKATNRVGLARNVEDITVRDCVFYTLKSSLKVGTETRTDYFRNITFENIDVVQADRAVSLYLQDSGRIEDVYFKHIRVEKIAGTSGRRLIDLQISDRGGSPPRRLGPDSTIRNIYFDDFTALEPAPNGSRIAGFDQRRNISHLYFSNFRIGGRLITNLDAGRFAVNKYVATETISFSDQASAQAAPVRAVSPADDLPQVRIVAPRPDEVVRGQMVARFQSTLPAESIRTVSITIGEKTVSAGTLLPAEVVIDTWSYDDGELSLTVSVHTVQGAVASDTVKVLVDNWWELTDDLLAPIQLIGLDRSRTLQRSTGWSYTDTPAGLFGDAHRMTRNANTTEELVWAAPGFVKVAVHLFTQAEQVKEAVQFSVSADGEAWTEIPYTATVASEESGWCHLVLQSEVGPESQVALFKLTLRESSLPAGAVQVAQVVLTGRNM